MSYFFVCEANNTAPIKLSDGRFKHSIPKEIASHISNCSHCAQKYKSKQGKLCSLQQIAADLYVNCLSAQHPFRQPTLQPNSQPQPKPHAHAQKKPLHKYYQGSNNLCVPPLPSLHCRMDELTLSSLSPHSPVTDKTASTPKTPLIDPEYMRYCLPSPHTPDAAAETEHRCDSSDEKVLQMIMDKSQPSSHSLFIGHHHCDDDNNNDDADDVVSEAFSQQSLNTLTTDNTLSFVDVKKTNGKYKAPPMHKFNRCNNPFAFEQAQVQQAQTQTMMELDDHDTSHAMTTENRCREREHSYHSRSSLLEQSEHDYVDADVDDACHAHFPGAIVEDAEQQPTLTMDAFTQLKRKYDARDRAALPLPSSDKKTKTSKMSKTNSSKSGTKSSRRHRNKGSNSDALYHQSYRDIYGQMKRSKKNRSSQNDKEKYMVLTDEYRRGDRHNNNHNNKPSQIQSKLSNPNQAIQKHRPRGDEKKHIHVHEHHHHYHHHHQHALQMAATPSTAFSSPHHHGVVDYKPYQTYDKPGTVAVAAAASSKQRQRVKPSLKWLPSESTLYCSEGLGGAAAATAAGARSNTKSKAVKKFVPPLQLSKANTINTIAMSRFECDSVSTIQKPQLSRYSHSFNSYGYQYTL